VDAAARSFSKLQIEWSIEQISISLASICEAAAEGGARSASKDRLTHRGDGG